jgi:hypothetical protein
VPEWVSEALAIGPATPTLSAPKPIGLRNDGPSGCETTETIRS